MMTTALVFAAFVAAMCIGDALTRNTDPNRPDCVQLLCGIASLMLCTAAITKLYS